MHKDLKFVFPTMAAIAAGLLAVAPLDAAPNGSGAMKLEGAWIAKVPGTPAQWSYVVSPDPSGRRASLHGSIEVGFGNPLGSDYNSPLLGQAAMTGPDTVKFYSMWYGISRTTGIVYIGVDTGEVQYLSTGEAIGTHNMAFYLPSADADGDGLPDPGATPVFVRPPLTTLETRLPIPK
jgi:hypothetical protein